MRHFVVLSHNLINYSLRFSRKMSLHDLKVSLFAILYVLKANLKIDACDVTPRVYYQLCYQPVRGVT